MGADAFLALDAWFERLGVGALPDAAAPPTEPVASPSRANESSGDATTMRAVAESARWYARLNDALDAACARLLREIQVGRLVGLHERAKTAFPRALERQIQRVPAHE